jgi:hypothetical protein
MRRIFERIIEGLACSAQAVAWHEGQAWQPERRLRRDTTTRDHHAD